MNNSKNPLSAEQELPSIYVNELSKDNKRMKFLCFFLFLSSQAYAFKRVIVKTVSRSGRTFVINQGKKDGINEGQDATFHTADVNIVARAIVVNRLHSQWVALNRGVYIPFDNEEIITYNPTTEHVNALIPEYLAEKILKKHTTLPPNSVVMRSALTSGLSSSTSGIEHQNLERGGLQLDLIYDWTITKSLLLSGGVRFEQEQASAGVIDLTTNRVMALFGFHFQFPEMTSFYRSQIFVNAYFGLGSTTSTLNGTTYSGVVNILPEANLGLELPIDQRYQIILQAGIESLAQEDTLPDNTTQTTNQTSFKMGLGLRIYFEPKDVFY